MVETQTKITTIEQILIFFNKVFIYNKTQAHWIRTNYLVDFDMQIWSVPADVDEQLIFNTTLLCLFGLSPQQRLRTKNY